MADGGEILGRTEKYVGCECCVHLENINIGTFQARETRVDCVFKELEVFEYLLAAGHLWASMVVDGLLSSAIQELLAQ